MTASDVNPHGVNPLEDTESDAALAYAEERRENIRTFVRTSPDYYIGNFDRIGASSRFTATFNLVAGIFGPVWFGASPGTPHAVSAMRLLRPAASMRNPARVGVVGTSAPSIDGGAGTRWNVG